MVFLESVDPMILSGFWVPEMVGMAGGRDVLQQPGDQPVKVGMGGVEHVWRWVGSLGRGSSVSILNTTVLHPRGLCYAPILLVS